MLANKKIDEDKQANVFTKEQLVSAKKYKHVKDRLNVVLKDDRSYTLKEVDDLIENFMKEKVN
jgi:hypothetical protein